MEAVRWGILGVAEHFIKRVVTPLSKSPLINLYGIASRDAQKAKAAAAKFNILHSYSSYEDLLADKAIEAVYIPLPNNLHVKWIKKAALSGKHIMCEKPLALSAHEAEEGIAFAGKKGVRLMEAFMYRLHPQWQRARELITTGEIGTIQAIHTRFSYYLSDPSNVRNRIEMGGGALRDIGCYAISIARFLLDTEPVRAISLINRDPNFKTDILTSVILDFHEVHTLFTVSTQTFSYQSVDIHGSGGYIHIDIPFNIYPDVPAEVTVTNDIGTRTIKLGPADQYGLEFEAFSHSIREHTSLPIPPEDTINNQKVIDAIFESEKSRQWVQIR